MIAAISRFCVELGLNSAKVTVSYLTTTTDAEILQLEILNVQEYHVTSSAQNRENFVQQCFSNAVEITKRRQSQ